MDYKLIKLKEGYIIVSDKEIKEADIHINLLTKEIERASKNLSKNFIGNSNFNFSVRKQYKKIIASNFIPELPNIDFNNLEEEFGIIGIDKLVSKINTPEGLDQFSYDEGFKLGFNKCLELNKNKLFTEKNINPLREILIDGALSNMSCSSAVVEFDKIIKSLQPKTEWDVEVEKYCGTGDCYLFGCQKYEGCKHENLQKLKIIDNKIKITKIL